MPAVRQRRFLIWLIASGGVALLGLGLISDLRGPTAADAYRRIFGRPPPEYVRELRIKYYKHMKGNGIYFGFRVPPARLDGIPGISLANAIPMYFADVDYMQPWQHEAYFRELFPGDFPDPTTLKRHSIRLPDEIREFVFSPQTGHVFCFRLIDSDIDL